MAIYSFRFARFWKIFVILRLLSDNLDAILDRIRNSHLQRYGFLQHNLFTTNVGTDLEYQCVFNGFYKMQRRDEHWYRYYFSLLEREKNNKTITFQKVIEQIYSDNGRVEPSFSSKLVATIRPDQPVYDRHVCMNLDLKIPGAHKSAVDRLKGYVEMYATLEAATEDLIKAPAFTRTLRPAFDNRFAEYTYIADVKKLDFLIWQFRTASKNAYPKAVRI